MSPERESPAPPLPAPGRLLVRGLLLVGGAVALVLLVFGAARIYLRTPAGSARLLRFGLEAANGAIAGRVDAGGVRIEGDRIFLRDITLSDPEGTVVASVDEAEVDLVFGALLLGRIEARSVRVVRPALTLAVDEEGSSLDRAFAAKSPAPEPARPGGRPPPLTFVVHRFDIEDGRMEVQIPDAPHFSLRDLALSGAGRYALRSEDFELEVRGNGALDQPTPGPVTVAGRGARDGRGLRAELDLRAAGASLVGDLHTERASALDAHLALDVPPALGRALVPGWPLRVAVRATGEAKSTAPGNALTVEAAAGRARLRLAAEVDVAQRMARRLRLEARHVDLAELLGHGPSSNLAFTATGSASGVSWASASGRLELEMPPAQVRGEAVGPVKASLQLRRGRLEVSALQATLPGLKLEAQGSSDRRGVEASLSLEVTDLAAWSRVLGDVAGPMPPLSGQGSLRGKLSGRLTHPRVEAEGHFGALVVGPASAQALDVELRLPDLGRPLDATAKLHADLLAVAGRTLRDVRGTLSSEGRAVELQLTAAAVPLRLHLAGTADPDARGLLLDTLELGFSEGTWQLRAPAAVRLEPERLETERLELTSGDQSIEVTGRLSRGRVDGSLHVAHLDLARLPSIAVPASEGLGGTLDLSAEVHGLAAHPDLALDARLEGGAWHGLAGLAGHVEGRRRGAEVHLAGHVDALATGADVSLDGPETALTRRTHRPLSVEVRATDVDLGRGLCELAAARLWSAGCPDGKPLATGRVDVQAALAGFADAPRVQLSVRATEVVSRKLASGAWSLDLEGDDARQLQIKLAGQGLGGKLHLAATLEATTGELLARRRSWAGWRTVPVRGQLEATGLSLADLRDAGLATRDVQGTARVQAEVSGTLADPRGKAEVMVQQLVMDPWGVGDVRLVLSAEEQVETGLTLAGGVITGSAHLSVGTRLASLWENLGPEALARVPVHLDGNFGPVQLRDLPLEAGRLRRDRRLLDGELTWKVEGQGSLGAPTATAELGFRGLGPGDGAHVDGQARVRYADGRHVLDASLKSTSGGSLDADGTLALDLSLPALRRGLHPAEAPVQLRLHSVRFQPDFVATLVPWLRSVTGTLQIEGQATGTLGKPVLRGSLAWDDGSMGIIGFGLYQGIHLRASAGEERFAIEELSARVQGGTVSLKLSGQRAGAGFAVQGELATRDFPVVIDDQLLCIATTQATLQGQARPWVLDLSPVTFTRAELQLPESKRKNLQDLSSPPDVVLTRHGVAIDRHQALRALALDPRRRGRGPEASEGQSAPLFRLALSVPNAIDVRGRDVRLELTLSREFRVELGEETLVHGEVRLRRGRAEVWGRRFEVQPGGRVTFEGPVDQPRINVTGVYTNSQEQVTVYMHFSGLGNDVQVTPSSTPPLSEPEIYTLLATGRTTLKQSSLGSSAAVGSSEAGVSILGSWAAGELKKAVGGALPIDVISIEVGQERGVQQTKFEAGKYLTDDIYIGYQARIGADPFRYQNANALRVEYQFLRRWSLQLEYGDANAGSLDAVWSRDY
jgi:translocation and assembly module TamB